MHVVERGRNFEPVILILIEVMLCVVFLKTKDTTTQLQFHYWILMETSRERRRRTRFGGWASIRSAVRDFHLSAATRICIKLTPFVQVNLRELSLSEIFLALNMQLANADSIPQMSHSGN
jgi:hypothetical protein